MKQNHGKVQVVTLLNKSTVQCIAPRSNWWTVYLFCFITGNILRRFWTKDQRKHGHMFRFVCDVRSLNYCYISIILTRWVQPCYFNFRLGDNVGACNSQRQERMLSCILFYIRKRVCPSSWLLCYSIINIRSLIQLYNDLIYYSTLIVFIIDNIIDHWSSSG
jgi:hypothetical protein